MTHKHEWDTTSEGDTLTKTCPCGSQATLTLTLVGISRQDAPVQKDALDRLHDSLERLVCTSAHVEWREEP
jgi:hypothetical protein